MRMIHNQGHQGYELFGEDLGGRAAQILPKKPSCTNLYREFTYGKL